MSAGLKLQISSFPEDDEYVILNRELCEREGRKEDLVMSSSGSAVLNSSSNTLSSINYTPNIRIKIIVM